MKSDAVISAVISYLKDNGEFMGQASVLAEKIKLDVKGNVLTRKLKRYENELKKIGIEFVKNRTGEKRELLLVYTPQ